jgi:hypothetical protein
MNIEDYILSNNLDKINVFVYCSGKSGGSSLANTLYNHGYKVLHVHNNTCMGFFDKVKIDFSIVTTNELITYNSSKYPNNTIYVIDSYRTPIERKISAYFQHLHKYFPDYKNTNINTILQCFNDKNFIYCTEEYQSFENLFNYFKLEQINNFDFENNYVITQHNNIKFIKLRFNNITSWDTMLSTIFNKQIKILPCNITRHSDKGKLYQKFKKRYVIPKQYLEHFLPYDKYFKVFTNELEKKDYYEYWNNKSINEIKPYHFVSFYSELNTKKKETYVNSLKMFGILPTFIQYDTNRGSVSKIIKTKEYLDILNYKEDDIIVDIDYYGAVFVKNPLEMIEQFKKETNIKLVISAEKEFSENDPYSKQFFDKECNNKHMNGGFKLANCLFYHNILKSIFRNKSKYICDNLFSEQIIYSRYCINTNYGNNQIKLDTDNTYVSTIKSTTQNLPGFCVNIQLVNSSLQYDKYVQSLFGRIIPIII